MAPAVLVKGVLNPWGGTVRVDKPNTSANRLPRRDRGLQFLFVGLLLLATAAIVALAVNGPTVSRAPKTVSVSEDPPPDFDWEKLKTYTANWLRVNHRNASVDDVRLLAWHTMEDDRPLRVIHALVWAKLKLYGPPDEAWWDVSDVYDGFFEGERSYTDPPTNADVYDFLSQPDDPWYWTPRDGFSILAGDVREHTWTEVIGEKPMQFYPKGVER
jgi:hypothetical protein